MGFWTKSHLLFDSFGSNSTKVPNPPQHFEKLLESTEFTQKRNSQIWLSQNADILGDTIDTVLRAGNHLRWRDLEEKVKIRLLRYGKYPP